MDHGEREVGVSWEEDVEVEIATFSFGELAMTEKEALLWEAKASPTRVIQRDGHVTVFLAMTVNDPIAELWGHSLILKKGKRK